LYHYIKKELKGIIALLMKDISVDQIEICLENISYYLGTRLPPKSFLGEEDRVLTKEYLVDDIIRLGRLKTETDVKCYNVA